jgi:hypothetical protein
MEVAMGDVLDLRQRLARALFNEILSFGRDAQQYAERVYADNKSDVPTLVMFSAKIQLLKVRCEDLLLFMAKNSPLPARMVPPVTSCIPSIRQVGLTPLEIDLFCRGTELYMRAVRLSQMEAGNLGECGGSDGSLPKTMQRLPDERNCLNRV